VRRFLLTFLVPIIAFGGADVGDYLTSEEEILDALARDEINYTQYYDLIELFREKVSVFGDDLDRLLVIPGVDRRWISGIREAAAHAGQYADKETFLGWFPYDFERIESFVIFEKRAKGDFGGGTRVYTHGRFIDSDPYYPKTYINLSGRYLKSSLEIRLHEDRDGVRCRRRNLEARLFGGDITLGSFRKGLGEGLIMGKPFYIPGATRENSFQESFGNPQDNLFNGVRFGGEYGRIGTGFLASRIVYDSVSVSAIGAELFWIPRGNLKLGGVYSYGDAKSRPGGSVYRQNSGSVFGSAKWEDTDISGEMATTESGGIGFMLSFLKRASKTKTLAELWSYSEDFHPMHSKGLSDYRQTDIELDNSGVTQRSREAGETGFELKITSPLSENIFLNLDQSGWRTPPIEDWGISSEIGLYYRGENGRRIHCEFSWLKRTLTSGIRLKETIRMRANWPLIWDIECNAYFRLRWTTTETDRTRGVSVYPEIVYSRFEPFALRLRIKRYKSNLDDPSNGYWELRFRDELRSGPLLWIAEIRHAQYDKTDKNPLTEFRVTASYLWR